MKKAVACYLSVVMSVCMMAGFTTMAAEDNALERIKERGTLIVATDAAWPPFCLLYTSRCV